MMLLIDMGNSRIKWACCTVDEWIGGGSVPSPTGYDALQFGFLDNLAVVPDRVAAVNVVGDERADSLALAVRQRWNLSVEFARSRQKSGVLVNAYAEPRQLGADRWLAMVAARHYFRGPLCVVDAGTAMTVDLIESDGGHLGGFIVPGLTLMRAALERETREILSRSRLLPEETNQMTATPAKTTAEALSRGALLAATGLVDRGRAMTARPARVIVTGGDAEQLLPLLPRGYRHRPQLVLEGLALDVAGMELPMGLTDA